MQAIIIIYRSVVSIPDIVLAAAAATRLCANSSNEAVAGVGGGVSDDLLV